MPDQRIVTSYVTYLDQTRISVSVATDRAGAADTGAQREHGTRELLDALGRSLEWEPARA